MKALPETSEENAPRGSSSADRADKKRVADKNLQPSYFGGAKRDRTADLLNAIQALSQLSYSPFVFWRRHLPRDRMPVKFFSILFHDNTISIAKGGFGW